MPTIDDVRDLVWRGHKKGARTPEEALNRLWKIHLDARKEKYGTEFVSSAPEALTAENTSMFPRNGPLTTWASSSTRTERNRRGMKIGLSSWSSIKAAIA